MMGNALLIMLLNLRMKVSTVTNKLLIWTEIFNSFFLLDLVVSVFGNSVDQDQLASSEAS